MAFYITRRLAWTAVVVLVVLMLTFAVFYLMPAGDPALRFAGSRRLSSHWRSCASGLGLDQPWYTQFAKFAKNFVAGRPVRVARARVLVREQPVRAQPL